LPLSANRIIDPATFARLDGLDNQTNNVRRARLNGFQSGFLYAPKNFVKNIFQNFARKFGSFAFSTVVVVKGETITRLWRSGRG